MCGGIVAVVFVAADTVVVPSGVEAATILAVRLVKVLPAR